MKKVRLTASLWRWTARIRKLTAWHWWATDVSLIPVFEESQVYEADGKAAALVVSNNAEQLNKDSGELINGLYAAGPILSAAVDGEGVLSGNELTEAVVFGSTAGTEAAVYVSDNQ